MKDLMEVLGTVYKHRKTMALGLIGCPGVAKTSMVYQFAKGKKKKVVEIITSQDSPTEISGMSMPITEDRKMNVFDFERLLSLKNGDILFFDEFLNGNIQVLNACLTLVTQRMMRSGRKLPDVMIVSSGNEFGAAHLLPQTKQRFWWVEVNFHAKTWCEYIEAKYGVYPSEAFCSYITGEEFHPSTWNHITPRTAEQIIELVLGGAEPNDPIFRKMFGPGSECFSNMAEDIKRTYAKMSLITILKSDKLTLKSLTKAVDEHGVSVILDLLESNSDLKNNESLMELFKKVNVPDQQDDDEGESYEVEL
jgi:hypothetical protein